MKLSLQPLLLCHALLQHLGEVRLYLHFLKDSQPQPLLLAQLFGDHLQRAFSAGINAKVELDSRALKLTRLRGLKQSKNRSILSSQNIIDKLAYLVVRKCRFDRG